MLQIKGQGHGRGQGWKSQHGSNIQLTCIPCVPCQSGIPFLSYDFFEIWPWKSRVKIMGEVTVQSHNVSNILLNHIPFVPCQSGIPFLSYNFSIIWPWKSRVKVMSEVTVLSHNVGLTSYRLTSLPFYVNWPSISWDTALSKFDQGQGQMTMMLHNYRSRRFHRTLV